MREKIMSKQAVVIGGSGMLEQASLWLADRYSRVSVIGRDLGKLNRLQAKNAKINPISVDYKDSEAFERELDRVMQFGKVDLVAAWIHTDAPEALRILIEQINTLNADWKLYHILGSRSDMDKLAAAYKESGLCSYRQVKLGFVLEKNSSRWLTNEEISGGVIQAIELDEERYIVGVISPWDQRPGWV